VNVPENCHSILKKGLLAAAETEWPPQPYHLGGLRPVCPALGQVRISIWCAEVPAPSVPSAEQATYVALLEQARAYVGAPLKVPMAEWADYAHGVGLKSDEGKTYNAFATASTPLSKRESPGLLAIRNACGGAATLARGKPDLVFSSAQAAFGKVVKFLGEKPSGLTAGAPVGVRALLSWIDEEIMRLEAAAAMADRAGRPVAVDRVLWRGADDKKKKTVHFLAVLRGGAWGLVTKIGRNWAFVEGTRDTVAASIPDPMFKEAMASAQARLPS
jgi:hypothetical protein